MQNYYALTDRTIIPANSDLNDYTTVGSYLVPSASADTLANKPWPGNQGAYITVSRYSSELFKGMVAKVFGGSIYYRDYENGTWHDWKTIMTNADLGTGFVSSGAFTDIVQDGIYYISNNVIGKPGNAGGTYILASPYGEATTQCGLYIENLPNGGVYKIIRSGGDQQHIRIDQ